jgi:hypothetical protein
MVSDGGTTNRTPLSCLPAGPELATRPAELSIADTTDTELISGRRARLVVGEHLDRHLTTGDRLPRSEAARSARTNASRRTPPAAPVPLRQIPPRRAGPQLPQGSRRSPAGDPAIAHRAAPPARAGTDLVRSKSVVNFQERKLPGRSDSTPHGRDWLQGRSTSAVLHARRIRVIPRPAARTAVSGVATLHQVATAKGTVPRNSRTQLPVRRTRRHATAIRAKPPTTPRAASSAGRVPAAVSTSIPPRALSSTGNTGNTVRPWARAGRVVALTGSPTPGCGVDSGGRHARRTRA